MNRLACWIAVVVGITSAGCHQHQAESAAATSVKVAEGELRTSLPVPFTNYEPITLPKVELDRQAVPEGYSVSRRPNSTLIATGAIVFGSVYATTVGIAAASGFSGSSGYVAIPVAGPLLFYGRGDFSVYASILYFGGTAISSLAQLGGLGTLAAGFVFPRKRLTRNSSSEFAILPTITSDVRGLQIVGVF